MGTSSTTFEGQTAGNFPATLSGDYGTFAVASIDTLGTVGTNTSIGHVSNAAAQSGSLSGRISAAGGVSASFVWYCQSMPGNSTYFRSYFRPNPTSKDYALALCYTGAYDAGAVIGVTSGLRMFVARRGDLNTTPTGATLSRTGTVAIQPATWHRMEGFINDTEVKARLWLGGRNEYQSLPNETLAITASSKTWGDARIGVQCFFANSWTAVDGDVFLDNLAVSDGGWIGPNSPVRPAGVGITR